MIKGITGRNYRAELPAGTYTIDINYYENDTCETVPRKIKCEAGLSYMLDMSIIISPDMAITASPYPDLSKARPYRIIGEVPLICDDPARRVMDWLIVSENASGFEEYAQTCIRAVIDLYSLYKADFTGIILIPQPDIKQTFYASAFYAADGKGAWGMTGSSPAKPCYWHADAITSAPYNGRELSVKAIWEEKMFDFPAKDPFSSLSYDEKGLREYIAGVLDIPYSETQIRILERKTYNIPDMPLEETAWLTVESH